MQQAQEDAIRQWVLAGSGLAADHVIFHQQTGARPLDANNFATIRIGDTNPVACVDEVQETYNGAQPAGQEIAQTVTGLRSVNVTVQFFGAPSTGDTKAQVQAQQTQVALALPSVRNALGAAGLTPYDTGRITNVTALIGTKFEGRAVLDMHFYVLEQITEQTGYITSCVPVSYMGPPDLGTAADIDI